MSFRFFISYARLDRDSYLSQFFADLQNEVAGKLGVSAESVSFVDTRNIEAGDQWEPTLADALRTSRSCVALCSQGYLNSTYCGKEYQIFRERRDAWLRAHPDDRGRVIFPVLWRRPVGGLPDMIACFQYTDDRLPDLYAKEGLRYLMQLSRYRDQYQDFVSRFAQTLVNAGDATPIPDLATLSPLSAVPSAFHAALSTAGGLPEPVTAGAPNNVRFVFVVARRGELRALRDSLDGYHDNAGWFWRPYYPHTDVTVGLLAQETASRLKLRYIELEFDQNLVDRLRELENANELVVCLIDAWSICLPHYADPMRRYDQAMLANCAVLVLWNDLDPETAAQREVLKQALEATFPRKTQVQPPGHHWDSIRCERDLREELEKVLNEVRMVILRVSEAQRKAESEELTRAAQGAGITLRTKPELRGPAGGPR